MFVFLQFFLESFDLCGAGGYNWQDVQFLLSYFSCFKFCIFKLLCFDLCGAVGGHNVQFVLSAFLQFCTFAFSAFLLGKF